MAVHLQIPRPTTWARLLLVVVLLAQCGVLPVHGATPMGRRAILPLAVLYCEKGSPECKDAWAVLQAAGDAYWGEVRVTIHSVRWNRSEMKEHRITKTPTVLYLTYAHREVSRHEGSVTLEQAKAAISQLIIQDKAEKSSRKKKSPPGSP